MDQGSQINSTLGAWRALTFVGKLAVLACCLAALVLLWQVGAAGLDLARLPAVTVIAEADAEGNVRAYEQAQERYAAMIDGRSLFVKPPRPRRERTPIFTTPRNEEPEDDRPTSYGGPTIIAMVGDQVWFDDDTRLRTGEESGSLEVVSVRAPWSARLRWRGEEFTETLFDRTGSAIPLLPDPEEVVDEVATEPGEVAEGDEDATEAGAEEAEGEAAGTGDMETEDESSEGSDAQPLDEE
jgi:hypothetical protein